MGVKIEQIKNFSKEITQNLNVLLMQLNPKAKKLSDEDVREIIENSSNYFFVARELVDNKIVGMLTLIIYRIPVWKKGWIEDLVVDKEHRNKGIATKLINYSIKIAKAKGVSSLNFTSNPQRETANKLYQSLGFEKRDTNVYKILL